MLETTDNIILLQKITGNPLRDRRTTYKVERINWKLKKKENGTII